MKEQHKSCNHVTYFTNLYEPEFIRELHAILLITLIVYNSKPIAILTFLILI